MKSQNAIFSLLEGDFSHLKEKVPSSVRFFGSGGIEKLQDQLKLHRFMSPSELARAILVLENIEINTSEFRYLHEMLNKERYRLLKDIQPDAPSAVSSLKCPYGESFARLLKQLHSHLLSQFELSLVHVDNELPVKTVHYDKSMLDESQAFTDLENTSKAQQLPDKSTSVKDFARRGVTLYGTVVHPSSSNNDKDPGIIEAIEGFAKGNINHQGTKANKLYQFGGQFLEAIMLNEFSHTIAFKKTGQQNIQPGLTKGHINWTKENSGEIVGHISIKVFTFNRCDLSNQYDMPKFYAIGSDGSSLLEIKNDELEGVNKRCSDEVKGKTENEVVPICTLSAKLGSVNNFV